MTSINGIQMNAKAGVDMRTQYMDQGINNLPNPDSAQANSLPNNPLYNMLQVLFNGKQTDNIQGYNKNDIFLQNGLATSVTNNTNPDDHQVFTFA